MTTQPTTKTKQNSNDPDNPTATKETNSCDEDGRKETAPPPPSLMMPWQNRQKENVLTLKLCQKDLNKVICGHAKNINLSI